MAETKARFLANLIGADNTANDFTLPNSAVSASDNKVLTSGGDGTVTWETTISAPTITSVTTPASDNSINVDDNVVMTVTGTNFADAGMTAKLVDASNEGVTVTGHGTSDLSVNYTNSTSISVTTRASTANISQSNVKLVVIKTGISATSASIGVSPDPTITSLTLNSENVYATLLDNLGSGQNIGSAISASSSDGASITYSISATTNNTYLINSSGQITTPTAGIGDVTSGTSYSETPVVTATAGGDSTRTATINVPLKINKYAAQVFSGYDYTGSSSNQNISLTSLYNHLDSEPDLVWIKERNKVSDDTSSHRWFDTVRGTQKYLASDVSDAEGTGGGLTAFLDDGFTVSGGDGDTNESSSRTYIAWGFQAGGAPSGSLGTIDSTTTKGAGTISSSSDSGYSIISNATNVTQSVNRETGFSITKFTGHADGVSIPHNLGGTPDWIIIKNLDASSYWSTWHSGMANDAQYYLSLNEGIAETSYSTIWPTAPSSTLVYGGTDDGNGGQPSTDYIMYAWKGVTGLSKFDTYQGNGQADANGKILNIGFLPRFIMIKCRTDAANWIVWDTFRSDATSSGHSMLPRLRANTEEEETSSTNEIQLYDNGSGTKGVQIRTTEGGLNNSSRHYIYMAFA